MVKILSAVSYLHKNSIIHRDLKPENILLVSSADDTEIKLTDFGLAKKADHDGLKTFCGTPQYFAPEVLRRKGTINGEGRYGTAADMWSLGVVLYILLTGTFPFDEDHLFDQIKTASYSLDGMEWRHISDAAKDLVQRMLRLNVKQRISVDDAMRHPWIQNIKVNDGAFKTSNKLPQYKQFQKSGTVGGKSNQWLNGVEGDTSSSSAATVQRTNSKPPIGTVALFLTNKKPSLQKKLTQPISAPAAEDTCGGQSSGQQGVSYEPLLMVRAHVPQEKTFNGPSVDGSSEVASSEHAPQPVVTASLVEDEIEDCSSSSGDESENTDPSGKPANSGGNKRRSKVSSNAPGRPSKKAKTEVTDIKPEVTATANGVKRQRTLADAWSKLAPTANTDKVEE